MGKHFVFTGSEVVQEFTTEPVSGEVVAGKAKLITHSTMVRFYSPGGEFEQLKAKHGSEYAEAVLIARNIVSWNVVKEVKSDPDPLFTSMLLKEQAPPVEPEIKYEPVEPTAEVITMFPQQIYLQLVSLILGAFADPLKKKLEPSSN